MIFILTVGDTYLGDWKISTSFKMLPHQQLPVPLHETWRSVPECQSDMFEPERYPGQGENHSSADWETTGAGHRQWHGQTEDQAKRHWTTTLCSGQQHERSVWGES